MYRGIAGKTSRKLQVYRLCSYCIWLLVLSGCSTQRSANAPLSTHDPPLYPEYQDLRVSVGGNAPILTKHIQYKVKASPALVLAFYRDKLASDSWGFLDQKDDDKLHSYWVQCCPIFGLDVTVVPAVDDITQVTLELTSEPCR